MRETPVHENRWFRLVLADVLLPDGRHLDHYAIRMRPAALTAAINGRREVLLLWRHRFITDTWGWELPGGVVEEGETPAQAAEREMVEETGWRPETIRLLTTIEPANGLLDSRHHICWAEGAEYVGPPTDAFESGRREWVSLARVPELISSGEMRCASTIAGLLLLQRTLDDPR